MAFTEQEREWMESRNFPAARFQRDDRKGGILDLKEDSGEPVLGKCPDCGFESPPGRCPTCGGLSLRQVWELCHNQKEK